MGVVTYTGTGTLDQISQLLENFSPGLDFWDLVTLCLEGQVRTYTLSKAVGTSEFTASLVMLVQSQLLSCSSREGNEPGDSAKITYSELLHKVCQFANVLRSQGTGLWQQERGMLGGQSARAWGTGFISCVAASLLSNPEQSASLLSASLAVQQDLLCSLLLEVGLWLCLCKLMNAGHVSWTRKKSVPRTSCSGLF